MIYRPVHMPEDFAVLHSDIDKLASWIKQNFLQFNAALLTSIRFMLISRKRQTSSSQPTLQINVVAMERVDDYKYLGVWISSNFSWSRHIAEVCHKA